MGAREPEKDWQGAVPQCPSTRTSPLREGRIEGAPFLSKGCQGGFPHGVRCLGENHPSGRTPGPFFLWRQVHHTSQTCMIPKALSARTRDTAGLQGGWSLRTLSSRASSLRALRSSVPRGVIPRGAVRRSAGRTGPRSPVPSRLLGTVLLGNRLPVPAAASSGNRLLQRCLPPQLAAACSRALPIAMATAASTRRRDVITPSPDAPAGEAASPGGQQ